MALLIICAMIAIVGGRILPAFTRNALQRNGIADTARLPSSNRMLDSIGISVSGNGGCHPWCGDLLDVASL